MVFHRIPGGGYVMGDSARLAELPDPALPFAAWPHAVALGPFYMQEREVTKEAYARFLAAVPEWAPANRAALAARGLVAEDYLADWDDGRPPAGRENEPVVYLSAFAAEAFAAWLSEQLPPAPGGGRWLVRLPLEPEWEYAARGGLEGEPFPRGAAPPAGHLGAADAGLLPVGQSPPNGYGLRDMLGSAWEWTADWYSPTRYLLSRDFATDYQTDVRFLGRQPSRRPRGLVHLRPAGRQGAYPRLAAGGVVHAGARLPAGAGRAVSRRKSGTARTPPARPSPPIAARVTCTTSTTAWSAA